METIPTANAEVAEKGKQTSLDCLLLPTVVRKILQQFSTKELIQVSLVNKLWNFEARSVMKKRGNLRANISSAGSNKVDPCQQLVALAADLEKMRIVPFSGICVDMNHGRKCQTLCKGSLGRSYRIILQQLTWKHFSVRLSGEWEHCKSCPALLFVMKVLEDYGRVLEELTLWYGTEGFFTNIFRDRSLSCLKILSIEPCEGSIGGRPASLFMKNLVSCMPNLKEVHLNRPIDLMVNVLEGSSAVLVLDFRFFPTLEPICQSLLGSIRGTNMEIYIHCGEINPALLSTSIPILLEGSRTTLNTLIMDLLVAVPLMCYGVCLENVTELELRMNGNSLAKLEPHIWALVKGLNFTRVFPKLESVTISDKLVRGFSSDPVSAFVEQGNAALRTEMLPDRAINIKLLKIYEFSSMHESTIPYLAQMFPDVKTVNAIETPGCSFTHLRKHFLRLEDVIETHF